MRVLRFIGKTILTLGIGAGICFYIVVNYSTTQTAITCNGEWRDGGSETVYAVLEEYRPWIFWADSDGNFTAEARNLAMTRYVAQVTRVGRGPLVSYFLNDHSGKMIGGYRGGPNELTFSFTDDLVFIGDCTEGI